MIFFFFHTNGCFKAACYEPRVLLPQPMISTINIDLDFIYIYMYIFIYSHASHAFYVIITIFVSPSFRLPLRKKLPILVIMVSESINKALSIIYLSIYVMTI